MISKITYQDTELFITGTYIPEEQDIENFHVYADPECTLCLDSLLMDLEERGNGIRSVWEQIWERAEEALEHDENLYNMFLRNGSD